MPSAPTRRRIIYDAEIEQRETTRRANEMQDLRRWRDATAMRERQRKILREWRIDEESIRFCEKGEHRCGAKRVLKHISDDTGRWQDMFRLLKAVTGAPIPHVWRAIEQSNGAYVDALRILNNYSFEFRVVASSKSCSCTRSSETIDDDSESHDDLLRRNPFHALQFSPESSNNGENSGDDAAVAESLNHHESSNSEAIVSNTL